MVSLDRALLERVITGDEAALTELVRLFLPSLYRFVKLLVQDHDLTEDIVQETWVKIWRSLDRYNTERPFATWAFTIAKNTALDVLRKKSPLPLAALSEAQEEYITASVPSIEADIITLLEKEEGVRKLDQALEQLSPEYQLVLSLCYREELTLHEIAAVTGIGYNTIKSQHQRALKKLRQILDPASVSATHSYN